MAVPVLSLVLHFCLSAAAAAAVDFNYPTVFNFGDSNSDTGNLIAAGIQSVNPPYGQNYFHKPSGRFCDGRLIVDFLMDAMDLPFLNAYLDSVGAPSFVKGINFAAAGSTVVPNTPKSVSPFPFGIQIVQFLRFKERVLELQAKRKGRRSGKYIPEAEFFSKGLYMFDIGQNDIFLASYAKSEDELFAYIPTILAEFETGLKKLYGQGARKLWIHNTGPVGCLPRSITSFGKDLPELDELGCVSFQNKAAKLFNLQLHALCRRLQGEFGDVSITYIDIFSIKYDLIANHSRYGFVNPLAACCGYGGLPYNYVRAINCGNTVIVNGSAVTATGCKDTTRYINWDGVHYTEAANLHVSSKILSGKYSDPPCPDKMTVLHKL